MPGPAVDILQQFGNVEDDQRYTRLVDLFADDAVYYDPFFGAQRGKAAIRTFMEHMEEVVPGSGATFSHWHTEADTDCGWATWEMVAPNAEGEPIAVPGQSLYRLSDGKVTFVADYLDCDAYRALRGPDAKVPDHAGSMGLGATDEADDGSGADVLRQIWQIQHVGNYSALADLFADDGVFISPIDGETRGREAITTVFTRLETDMAAAGARFELVDLAGDTNVGWSQWWCRFENGVVPGWTLHRFSDRKISYDHAFFDSNVAASLRT
jgi:ketosteroid isomerase-like protein